jgi:hypothetical protein
MAVVTKKEILATWKALAGSSEPGWRSIDYFHAGTCRVKLARQFPSNEEAMLIGYTFVKIPSNLNLPNGQGFRMERAELSEAGGSHRWLALIRQPAGGIELFASVVADILGLLSNATELNEFQVHRHLLGRVRGWQEFMRKGRDGLTDEAEQGLFAELYVLNTMLDSGEQLHGSVDAWKGPLDGLHDFVLPKGAIEIKSSMAPIGFSVKVGSLEQLNEANVANLFLVGIRLSAQPQGHTLVEVIGCCRETLKSDPSVSKVFENALLDVGYLDIHSESYTRRFVVSEVLIFGIEYNFPRLVPHNVPNAIRRAQYEIDLALVAPKRLTLLELIKSLGIE